MTLSSFDFGYLLAMTRREPLSAADVCVLHGLGHEGLLSFIHGLLEGLGMVDAATWADALEVLS